MFYLSSSQVLGCRCETETLNFQMLIVCLIILFDKAFLLILKNGTWRDGSVVKSTICPSRGPGLDSQHPHVCNYSFRESFWPSWAPDTHTHTAYRIQAKYITEYRQNTHMHSKIIKKYNYLKMNFYFFYRFIVLYILYIWIRSQKKKRIRSQYIPYTYSTYLPFHRCNAVFV